MASLIAESSRVHPDARLAEDVSIGPGCVVGAGVTIGRGTRLVGHVNLMGTVTIGEHNTIGLYTALGGEPQDVSYWGSPTRVEIGDHNIICEYVTIHRASEKEDRVTRIGNSNRLMTGSHVAHDCQLADGITIGHGTLLAGHAHIESGVVIGEKSAILQFVTCGRDSLIGGQVKVCQDVPPYMIADGNPTRIRGVNVDCTKRLGFEDVILAALEAAYVRIFQDKMPLKDMIADLDAHDFLTPEVIDVVKFLEAQHEGRLGRARDRPRAK